MTKRIFTLPVLLFVCLNAIGRSPIRPRGFAEVGRHYGDTAKNYFSPIFCRNSTAQLSVTRLRTEHLPDPLNVGTLRPRLSWQLEGALTDREIVETAYEINVSDRPNGKGNSWSTGKVRSDESQDVVYAGAPLASGKKYYWRVRAWDNSGRVSPWSEPAWWQMALLDTAEWKAQWIEPGLKEEDSRRSPLLRTSFMARGKVASATAYITAHGLYEAQLNGKRIGNAVLTPGWTSYHKRLQYQAYDVTQLIHPGKNAIGAMLGSGWYRGYIGFEGQHNYYGTDIALLLQLVIRYTDGHTETVVSGPGWKSAYGEVTRSELYHGETIDHRENKAGWSLAGYDDAGWADVKTASFSKSNLVATVNEPVKTHVSYAPVRSFTTPAGEKVIDFGQNITGWVSFRAKGKAGDSIRISHSEVLDKNGDFYTENLRSAKAEDVFIFKGGDSAETFEPRFTFHGFRYIRIKGGPADIDTGAYRAIDLYSNITPTGSFDCSNGMINQLQQNIQRGQRGNFLDVPTDCPQRDERLGWTGDAQVFSRTAAFNYGVESFFTKWLKDLAADQLPTGAVPHVIPNVLGNGASASAGWADVATIIPWNIYLAYGDRRILEEQYPSMKAWVDYIKGQAKNDLWNTGDHFGDWLFYRPFDDNDGRSAVTDKHLIAQCFYAWSVQLLIKAATVIGKKEDAATYSMLLQRIKDAFLKEYITPNGRLVSGTQTAYVLALQFDMLPEDLRKQAAGRLVENIKNYNYHLTTGFLGTPYLCHVLSRYDQTAVAYRLLMQDTYPSWLYPVKMGATTIWERWDGIRPDSTFQTPGMNSFNHYAYGAIGDWMYRTVAGIDTYEDGPGYHHSRIAPHPGGGLTHAGAGLETGYGRLSCNWELKNDSLLIDVVIPANTSSTFYIPAPEGGLITEGGTPLATAKGVKVEGVERGYLIVRLGSGRYRFKVVP
jgi:alpha-L-rhamnosidase